MCIDNPLKKTGFQKKKGTRPHFRKIENIRRNQGSDRLVVSQKLLVKVKFVKTCSSRNQSNEYNFKKSKVINKNRFREATNETQKKNNNDCM
jgi:hypothetical protein